MGSGLIGMISLVNHTRIQADDIALLQNAAFAGNPMYYLIIYGHTDAGGIPVIMKEIGNPPQLADQTVSLYVNFPGGYAGTYKFLQLLMYNCQQPAGFPDELNLALCLNYYRHNENFLS